ncbi:hypothetical protein V5799_022936 [Amblyomma americanum]|uniref:Peptidase M13 N-terminal domain-containing protein n=1 Tax=Amblyomma americanum TaxID=6943 RepID=A0AAQ4FJ70_AMBAM
MSQRLKVLMLATAIFCTSTLMVYMGTTMWMRVGNRTSMRFRLRVSPTNPRNLSLISGCRKTACREYKAAIESSRNVSQDPCKDFYRYVCDGWKHHHRMLSVVDAAEDAMRSRALNTIEWAPSNNSRPVAVASSEWSVQERVAALARSCIDIPESSLDALKRFMAERHLPWPKTSGWDLLEVLLDLSGNWNVHLWFQVTFELAASSDRRGEPVMKISHSAAFLAWVASMRTFAVQAAGESRSLRYPQYVLKMLRLFGSPESRVGELLNRIQTMDLFTLEALGPALTESEPRVLRVPIRNMTNTATPGIAAGRLLLLLNEYFIWARRFTADDIVQVEIPSLLRSIVYLLGLKSETREALTLSLGLRLATELGWMADRDIADFTLELMGLPSTAHRHRCLMQVESGLGVAWLSLFSRHRGTDALVQNMRDVLADVVARRSQTTLEFRVKLDTTVWDKENYLADVIRRPTARSRFFVDWLNLMNAAWRLEREGLANVVKPGYHLSRRWSFQAPLYIAEDYFVFPLYHPDLPPAVNYGGAGRLIADEVLRGLFEDQLYSQQQGSSHSVGYDNASAAISSPPHLSSYQLDIKALLAALSAYRLAFIRRLKGDLPAAPSLADDRLFFVASCYALCSSADYVDELYGEASRRCNVPVRVLPEFAAAFQCKMPGPEQGDSRHGSLSPSAF